MKQFVCEGVDLKIFAETVAVFFFGVITVTPFPFFLLPIADNHGEHLASRFRAGFGCRFTLIFELWYKVSTKLATWIFNCHFNLTLVLSIQRMT